jgi:hypothetical protein
MYRKEGGDRKHMNRMKTMLKQLLTVLFIFCTLFLFGQSSEEPKESNIGVNYFGELGFRPGLELDCGLSFWKKAKEGKKRIVSQQLYLRPSFAYYHYSHYSNNLLLSMKLNYQVKFTNKENNKYLFVEPFLRLGYLRYFFIGDVFQTQNNGFEAVNLRGSNSFVFGGAFDVGGYISKRLDWIFGFDYYAESTEDNLILHRFVAKLGARIKLNTK